MAHKSLPLLCPSSHIERPDVKVLGVFDDPLLQCRSESTHLSPSNICSITLQDPQDRFQGVVGDILPGP